MTTLSPIRRSSRTDDNASSVDVIGIINRVGNAETDTAVAATIFKRNEIIQWSMPVEERPIQLFQFRERRDPPPRERDGASEADDGVEEYVSVDKTVTAPSARKKRTRRKHMHGRSRKSQNERVAMRRANEYEGGSRLVANAMVRVCGENQRSCLCDAIISILPCNKNRWLVGLDISSSMPDYGDTSVWAVSNTLATHGLKMKQVNGRYIKKAEYPIIFSRSAHAV